MNIQFSKKSFMYLSSLSSMINVRQTEPRKYPLLIGCGKYDIPMELSAVEMWKKNEPECGVIIFEGAGHCVNMDTPNKFNAAMEEFLVKWKRQILKVIGYAALFAEIRPVTKLEKIRF